MTLRQFRKQHGYTLKDISIETGCSIASISRYETNQADMPDELIEKIKNIYGVDIENQTKWYISKKKMEQELKPLLERITNLLATIDVLEKENKELKSKLESIRNIVK